MILVATIEGSGTMQLLKILGRYTCPLEERERAEPDQVLFAHLYDKMMPLVEAHHAREEIIITTNRPEADIRRTWEKRGQPAEELERQLVNYRRLLEMKPYVVELGQWR